MTGANTTARSKPSQELGERKQRRQNNVSLTVNHCQQCQHIQKQKQIQKQKNKNLLRSRASAARRNQLKLL